MADLLAYDVEATDADVRHGQVTQFGCVRATGDFEVLERRLVRVGRLPYVVPAPKAMVVTGTDPSELDDPGLPSEYEASAEIERALEPTAGGTVYVTYNGPRFDDELLRTTLFRNLRRPWFNSGRDATRVDLLPLVQLLHAARPGTIAVGTGEGGRASFRLEHVARANGVAIRAHTADGDAEATLDLARLVKARAPDIWEGALANGRSSSVEASLAAAATRGSTLWVFTHFGKPDAIPCAVLGTDGRKRWVLADRRVAAADFPTSPAAAAESLYRKESPFRVVKSGACPVILEDSVARLVVGSDHADFLGHPAGFFKAATPLSKPSPVARAAVEGLRSSAFEQVEAPTAEESIYDGFPRDGDLRRADSFHRSLTWSERASIAFEDARLREFAARLVVQAAAAGEADDVHPMLLGRLEAECAETMARPFAAADARWMTLASAREEGADADWEAWAERLEQPSAAFAPA